MATLLITHDGFKNHDTGPGHPERADRMRAIDKVLIHDSFASLVREEAPIHDDLMDAIASVHPKSHIDLVDKSRPRDGSRYRHIDGDTVMSEGSWEAGLRAVGAGLRALDLVFDNTKLIKNAFCQVRPPGHHAEANRAMGFCLFSNIAIAAHYARKKFGLERVAVIDFDVHHGNGTQDIFWSDKNLFYGSTHEMPLFPGTGAPNETGVANNICNAPLRARDGSQKFKEAYQSRVLPALINFRPDLILISAGFDAHEADPLANIRLVEADFLWVTQELLEISAKHCNGHVVSMLEGGYDLDALAKSVGVHVRALMDAG